MASHSTIQYIAIASIQNEIFKLMVSEFGFKFAVVAKIQFKILHQNDNHCFVCHVKFFDDNHRISKTIEI